MGKLVPLITSRIMWPRTDRAGESARGGTNQKARRRPQSATLPHTPRRDPARHHRFTAGESGRLNKPTKRLGTSATSAHGGRGATSRLRTTVSRASCSTIASKEAPTYRNAEASLAFENGGSKPGVARRRKPPLILPRHRPCPCLPSPEGCGLSSEERSNRRR